MPDGSRATKSHGFLKRDNITDEKLVTVRALNEVAAARGQSLAQMALRWVLRHETMTTALIGASRPEQIEENVASLQAPAFSADELSRIESILAT